MHAISIKKISPSYHSKIKNEKEIFFVMPQKSFLVVSRAEFCDLINNGVISSTLFPAETYLFWAKDSSGQVNSDRELSGSFKHSEKLPFEESKLIALKKFGIVMIDGISIT